MKSVPPHVRHTSVCRDSRKVNLTETAHRTSDMLQLVVTLAILNVIETAHRMSDTLQFVVTHGTFNSSES